MGAGQIGGIATLLDIDFNNAAGFIGVKADITEAQYIVYFLSHAMMFCTGSLIEAHVVLTTATCIYGEKYKFEVYAGSHQFLEHSGVGRTVDHMGIHRGYNHSSNWESCSPDNIALLVLGEQFHFNKREPGSEFIVNRVRYGGVDNGKQSQKQNVDLECKFYGWGSRRNGYLVPLLLHLRRVDVIILPKENCQKMWNYGDHYLCLRQHPCKDDLGTVLECSGFLRGLMVTRVIDRPCGVGYLDMSKYLKFLTCGVDDARDIVGHNDFMEFEFDYTTIRHPHTPKVAIVSIESFPNNTQLLQAEPDPGPPKAPSTASGESEAEAQPTMEPAHKENPTIEEEPREEQPLEEQPREEQPPEEQPHQDGTL